MDYKTIMGRIAEQFGDYPAIYERLMQSIVNKLNTPYIIQQRLKEKRDFGLKKYGEYSFQSTLANSLSTPTMEHAEEELVDALNYLAHEHYKSSLLYPQYTDAIDMQYKKVLSTLESINELKEKIAATFNPLVEDPRD